MDPQKKILNISKKRTIYEFILENPGIHKREISRQLKIPLSTLGHHLRYLEKYNLILSKYIGGYIRYSAVDKIGKKDKEMLILLRQETPRNIILSLTMNIIRSQIDLSEDVDKSQATIAFHLKKLKEMELIEEAEIEDGMIKRLVPGYWMDRKPRGKEKFYRMKSEEILYRIYNLMIAHYQKLPDDPIIKTFIEVEPETFTEKNIVRDYKVLQSPKSMIESVEEALFDIFPIPFCA